MTTPTVVIVCWPGLKAVYHRNMKTMLYLRAALAAADFDEKKGMRLQ
jgi:hypothetical protein